MSEVVVKQTRTQYVEWRCFLHEVGTVVQPTPCYAMASLQLRFGSRFAPAPSSPPLALPSLAKALPLQRTATQRDDESVRCGFNQTCKTCFPFFVTRVPKKYAHVIRVGSKHKPHQLASSMC